MAKTEDPRPKTEAEWLKVAAAGRPIGVDPDGKEVIRGVVIAQLGPFKSGGRGEFDQQSLATIVAMGNAAPNGLKCRLGHPNESDDGVANFLGRFRDFRVDSVQDRDSEGQLKTDQVAAVRADLYIDPSSHATPAGDLGKYVLLRAQSDPDSLSTSLVLQTEKEYRLNPDGTAQKDPDGNELPPLWRPTRLHASDIVDTGDAVDGMLAGAGIDVEKLKHGPLFDGQQLLDRQFAGQPREFVKARLESFLKRYLHCRYGLAEDDPQDEGPAFEPQPGDHTPGDSDPNPAPNAGGDEADDDEPLHDGCRSTLAYHHLTLCRLCNGVIASCGCDDRDRESRVVTMAREPCSACQAKLDNDAAPGVPGDPDDEGPAPGTGDAESEPGSGNSARGDAERCRSLRLLRLESEVRS